jgi:hypothetical protein
VLQATVSRYVRKGLAPPGSAQRWSTFRENHLREVLAVDFAVVRTVTFELVYVLFVLSAERRRVLHINVTRCATAEWTAQQVSEPASQRTAPRT